MTPKPFIFILFIVLTTVVFGQQNARRKVAVIGGGIAGVASIHYLLENEISADITLFEKEKVLGGNAHTSTIMNSFGDSVKVDIGPQFFTDETWEQYIALLRRYGLVSPEMIWEFPGTFVLNKKDSKRPVFISPKGLSKRGEKIRNLKQFYRFHKSAYDLYSYGEDSMVTVNSWLGSLELSETFKNEVILPFMASAAGAGIDELQSLSAKDVVKLFAFRGPLQRNTFYVLNEGMGNAAKTIGDSLVARGASIKFNSPVSSVRKNGNKFIVTTAQESSEFDFVIFAVHPSQAAKMLTGDSSFTELTDVLNEFEYIKAQIVLHRDSTFGYRKRSFLNVKTDADNNVLSNTMDLSCIHKDYTGIYKSWLKEDDLKMVRSNGTFIEMRVFEHPLITPEFMLSLEKLYNASSKFPNIYFAGGWSEGHDNQETAVNSGEKAAFKCRKFIEKY